jgi:hypothetical protein
MMDCKSTDNSHDNRSKEVEETLIGSLMYLENTWPDICFVGCLNYDIQLHESIDSEYR